MSILKELAENAVVVDKDYFTKRPTREGTTFIAGPVPRSLIEAAEDALGTVFPNEYRSFLSRYGALITTGIELSGITPCEIDGCPFFLNVVTETQAADHFLGEAYVVLSNDGTGITFLLDTADPGQIRIIARGPGVNDVLIASSLDEFIDGMLTDTFSAKLNATSSNAR